LQTGGRDPLHFSEKSHLLSGYSAVAWCPSSSDASSDLVALGATSGVLVVWNVGRGEVVQRFGGSAAAGKGDAAGAHKSRILDIAWSTAPAPGGAASHRIYTVAEGSGAVNEWVWDGEGGEAHRPRLARTLPVSKRGLTCVAVPLGASPAAALFVGGAEVAVLSLTTGARERSLARHSTPITSLAASRDGSVLVTGADERVLHLWDAEVEGAAGTGVVVVQPTLVLSHPGRPMPHSVSVLRVKKNVYHVLAVGEDGGACVWRYRRAKDGAPAAGATKPAPPACIVSLQQEERKKALGAAPPALMAAVLVSGADGPVLVAAAGSAGAPALYRSAYGSGEDASRPAPTLMLALKAAAKAAAPAAGAAAAAAETQAGGRPAGAETIGEARGAAGARATGLADESGAPAGGKKRKRAEEEVAPAAEEVAEEDGEWTLGRSVAAVVSALRNPGASDILAAAAGGAEESTSTPAAAARALTSVGLSDALLASGSLASVLTQALTARDDAQLELVLGSGDKGVIEATVRRLPPALILPFLARLVARFAAKPSRGAQLIAWLRALLSAHAGYLLGVPGLVPALEPLYSLVDNRLAVLKKLLKLQGRLDLLLAQVGGGGAGAGVARSKTIAKARLRVAQETLDAEAALGREEDGEEEEAAAGDDDMGADEEDAEEEGGEKDGEEDDGEEDEEDE